MIVHKKIKAPFVPKLNSDIDVNNFDVEFTNCEPESYENKSPSEDANDKFKDFSYDG